MIGKHVVACKLRLADGNQPLAVEHIVDAVYGDAPCLDEGGTERRLRCHLVAVTLQTLAHHVRLQREVAAQAAV